jgi:hypothetical protein
MYYVEDYPNFCGVQAFGFAGLRQSTKASTMMIIIWTHRSLAFLIRFYMLLQLLRLGHVFRTADPCIYLFVISFW